MAHNDAGQLWMGGETGCGQLLPDEHGHDVYSEIVDERAGFPVPQISSVIDAYSPGQDTVFFVTSNQMFFKLGPSADWKA
ncbi:MAG: hypothetical protein AAFQ98_24260, partial [Bacteroidota bacterium]